MSRLVRQLDGYRLTTAEIIYRLPDHPALLQSYIWQDFDLAPRFPVLQKFLAFWERSLDGRLHEVRVGAARLITRGEMRINASLFTLH
jgi:uncharacterized protein Usg